MRQWEYYEIVSSDAVDYNQLGLEGWELVSVYNAPRLSFPDGYNDRLPGGLENNIIAVFKRPVICQNCFHQHKNDVRITDYNFLGVKIPKGVPYCNEDGCICLGDRFASDGL